MLDIEPIKLSPDHNPVRKMNPNSLKSFQRYKQQVWRNASLQSLLQRDSVRADQLLRRFSFEEV